uniref:Ig-like domain-containing protein n=1 Tax=Oryzias melastigma TaxID=30732 RepID=A0A3B3BW65_ORYME
GSGLTLHVLGFFFLSHNSSGDTISPDQDQLTGTEGKSVTMKCNYQTGSSSPWLYWYKQDSDIQAPQFILWKGAKISTSELIPNNRYKSRTTETSTELIITKLTLADTALYYCAVDTQTQGLAPTPADLPLEEGPSPLHRGRFSCDLQSLEASPWHLQKPAVAGLDVHESTHARCPLLALGLDPTGSQLGALAPVQTLKRRATHPLTGGELCCKNTGAVAGTRSNLASGRLAGF